jgi:hypothetical protein
VENEEKLHSKAGVKLLYGNTSTAENITFMFLKKKEIK